MTSHHKTRPKAGSFSSRSVAVQPANAGGPPGVNQGGGAPAAAQVSSQAQPAAKPPPTDDLVVKNKRSIDELAKRFHQPEDIGPPLVKPPGNVLDETYLKSCVDTLAKGDPEAVRVAIEYLRSPRSRLPWEPRVEKARFFVESIFASADGMVVLAKDPKLFAVLMVVASDIGVDPSAVLTHLPTGQTAKELAMTLVDGCWKDFAPPLALHPSFRAWLLSNVDADDLNVRGSGRAGRLLNMLWNAGEYDAIKELLKNEKIDILQPATATWPRGPAYEGVYSGFVQPLGHVLAESVWLVHLLAQNKLPALKDPRAEQARAQKITHIAEMLKIVGGWKRERPFLTTYDEVLKSDLVLNFKDRPGTIWGFENIRMPFVHAVRANVPPQPLRMMELWETIRIALGKGEYAKLLADPDATIDRLIKLGVEDFEKNVAAHSFDYMDYGDIKAFIAEFEKQCRSYLEVLARPTRLPKYATAAVGGQDYTKYLGSFGCQAGLYWAEKTGSAVYYCIDGVDFKDVTEYKRFKTKAINAYLHNGKPAYTDAITLAELREILRHWDVLSETVVFVEKGKVLEDADSKVKKWRADLFADEGKNPDGTKPKQPASGTEPRLAPDRAALQTIIDRYITPLGLEPAHVKSFSERDIMRIASAVDMLRTAADAKDPGVVALCLQYADVLVAHAILPEDFAYGFKQMLAEKDPAHRRALAEGLVWQLTEAGISDHLVKPLKEVIRRLPPLPPPPPPPKS